MKTEQVVALYNRLKSLRKVMKITKRGESYVRNILEKNGIVIRDYREKSFSITNLIELYLKGYSYKELCSVFNISESTVNRTLNKHNACGTRIKTNMIKNPLSESQLYKSHNIPSFTDLTSASYYWMGILAADGNIKGTKVALSMKDKELVNKFKEFCNVDNNVRTCYKHYKNKHFPIYSYQFGSISLVKFLKNMGITENKTSSLSVSFPINWSYLLGFSDGDGCFTISHRNKYRWTVGICSETHFRQLCLFLQDNSVHYTTSIRSLKSTFYVIDISQKLELFKFINMLYMCADTFLERKYLRARYICEDIYKSPKFRKSAQEILKQTGNVMELSIENTCGNG